MYSSTASAFTNSQSFIVGSLILFHPWPASSSSGERQDRGVDGPLRAASVPAALTGPSITSRALMYGNCHRVHPPPLAPGHRHQSQSSPTLPQPSQAGWFTPPLLSPSPPSTAVSPRQAKKREHQSCRRRERARRPPSQALPNVLSRRHFNQNCFVLINTIFSFSLSLIHGNPSEASRRLARQPLPRLFQWAAGVRGEIASDSYGNVDEVPSLATLSITGARVVCTTDGGSAV
ncbi:hypothetical protein E2C01_005071 [Portunus trituberculatus]|uniref:Uncharacterized protein n=1 Tax=Portunus trituberculatus TaxID=210409 RepID=A0A5B7CRN6_PORTR|nr:hypothetical protein [Portunus trituberculatus]